MNNKDSGSRYVIEIPTQNTWQWPSDDTKALLTNNDVEGMQNMVPDALYITLAKKQRCGKECKRYIIEKRQKIHPEK